MAQRRSKKPQKRKSTRKKRSNKKGGFSLGRFTLGLLLLIVLGYAGMAIWEGKIVIDEVSDIDLPDFMDDDEPDIEKKDQPKQSPRGTDNKTNASTYKGNSDAYEEFNAEGFDLYFTKAFDFAWPKYSTTEAIIERPYYTVRFNEKYEQAYWVSYKLHPDSLKQSKRTIQEDFRADPRVRTGSAVVSDYAGSGFIKGQLAPVEDFAYDDFAISQSFYMSNVSPQLAEFNRGPWRRIEEKVREWTKEHGELFVVTGPLFGEDMMEIGANQVAVPKSFYKIVLDMNRPDIKAIAFLVSNAPAEGVALERFTVKIDQLEALTGLDFFPALPDQLEEYLESEVRSNAWKF